VKPVRPGGPPLYIAGQADVSVKRAARIGDAWLIVNTSGLGKVTALMQTYRAALKEYGRTPMEFPITVECYVGARHATAHAECRGPLEYKYNAYASWGLDFLPTEKLVRTRTDTTTTPSAFRGTDGSNPVPSSGESRANPTSRRAGGDRRPLAVSRTGQGNATRSDAPRSFRRRMAAFSRRT
jgi:alkanesulfonate monooxygenase SsuD/methylene tetrahydromethanopterin reductase-like flavin-dependent oxidoreductase (luciferase family)